MIRKQMRAMNEFRGEGEMLDLSASKILVVDDDARNLMLMKSMLKPVYEHIRTAESGIEALDMVKQELPDIILLDIMMPGMDGFEVVARLKAADQAWNVPVIMVTALEDRASRIKALDAGAEEIVTKPVDRQEMLMRIRNLLRLHAVSKLLKNSNQMLEKRVLERTRALESSFRETLHTLLRAAEYRDDDTGAHVQRISYYASHLAMAMCHSFEYCKLIFHASPMHDVGKIGVPDAVLLKPGSFEAEEWETMKSHAEIGYQILKDHSAPHLQMGAEIALHHHERWDGGGYPHRLKGEAIPLAARIMQICDVYDALRSERPYKKGFSHEKSVQIIIQGDGRTEPSHFDPKVLTAFAASSDQLAEIFAEHTDGVMV